MRTPCSLWSIWHRHTGVAWHAVVAQCVPWVRVHSLNWMCALYKHIPYFGFTFSMSLLYCIGALDWSMKSVHIFAVTWQLGPMMTRNVDRFFFFRKKEEKNWYKETWAKNYTTTNLMFMQRFSSKAMQCILSFQCLHFYHPKAMQRFM